MNCYQAIDLMGEAIEGVLTAHARAGFDDHLEECPACRTYFEQLELTCQALGRLPTPVGTSRRRSELIESFRKQFPRSG